MKRANLFRKLSWFFYGLLTALLITSCGFHLQGSEPLPPQLNRLYLDSDKPYSTFTHAAQISLTRRHITLVESPEAAPLTLHITNANRSASESSVATSQQTRQYSVTYTATFSITNAQGKTIVPAFSLSASQPLTMFSGQLLDNSSQLTQLEPVLQQTILNQLFNRLDSKNVRNMLNENPS